MGLLTVNVAALEDAVTKLTTLGDDVDTARRQVSNAVPRGASISTLGAAGTAGAFASWAEEQAASPLTTVLEIARLLDTQGSGTVTYTFEGEYSLSTIESDLGDIVATRLGDAESPEDLEKYLGIAANFNDNDNFQDALLSGLGQAGVVSLLTRAGGTGLPMDTVTGAFSTNSQDEIAGWVRDDIVDPASIDTETTTLLAGFGRSEAFSTSLYDDVTSEQMTEAIQHLNDEAYPNGIAAELDADAQDLYSQFINGAGTTFGTFTKAVDDPEALAGTWFDAITDDDHPGNAAALTFLIRKGGENTDFDPDFLHDLTEDVYQWERDQDGAVWGPRVESGESGMSLGSYLFDPDLVVEGDLDTIDNARRVDGLANLLGSMEYTPEAAQEFFASGYANGDPGATNSRVEYLMMDRTFSSGDGSDNGYGLGVALEAAASGNTTHQYIPGIGHSDEWSAGFATDLFRFIAHHEQEETGDGPWPDLLGDNRFHGYPGTSVALGNIGAAYSDDIYELLDNESYPASVDPASLQIDYKTLESVVGQIGHHDDMSGLETLSAGLLAEGNERFRTMLEDNPGRHTLAELDGLDPEGILDSNGEVLGKVLDLGLSSKAEGEDLAQKRAEFAAKAFDMATSFVPGAGDVASGLKDTLWETAIDTAKDQGLSSLKDAVENSPDATSGQYADLQNSQFEDLIRYTSYDQLLSTGYLDDYVGEGRIPESMIVGEGENRRFREDIRFEGVKGLPDDISSEERREIVLGMQYVLTNSPDVDGPGASLQGLIANGLNGYHRVRPPGDEDE